jgi:hypothetical protein
MGLGKVLGKLLSRWILLNYDNKLKEIVNTKIHICKYLMVLVYETYRSLHNRW